MARYRIYFCRQGMAVAIPLCGGDKGSQARGIEAAKRLLAEWMERYGSRAHDVWPG
jgi:putative addiction module killer protein